MSTTTWTDISEVENTPNNNPIKIIVPIALVLAVILGFVLYFISQQTVDVAFTGDYIVDSYVDLTPVQIRIIEVVSGHAWQQHGQQVTQAFDCLGRKGSTKSFKTKGFEDLKTNKTIPTNLWMCLDDDGSWYAVVTTIFEKVSGNKVARLVTAYKISTDMFPTINDYIDHIISKWGAIGISYMLNAEKFFLQPK